MVYLRGVHLKCQRAETELLCRTHSQSSCANVHPRLFSLTRGGQICNCPCITGSAAEHEPSNHRPRAITLKTPVKNISPTYLSLFMLTASWLLRRLNLSKRFCLFQNCLSGSERNKKVPLNMNETVLLLNSQVPCTTPLPPPPPLYLSFLLLLSFFLFTPPSL